MLKKLLLVVFVGIWGAGCATKALQVDVPQPTHPSESKAFVKIDSVQDLRQFERSPTDPSLPSIEGDAIENKKITDKAIGRMRHGMFHTALWNYSIKGNDDIYSVCRKIVESSLAEAGYQVVTAGHEQYSTALPLTVDILKFWAWMQPKFNIDLNFDGELRVRSLDGGKRFDVTGDASHNFSTAMAAGSAWTKLVREGTQALQKDLVEKLSQVELE